MRLTTLASVIRHSSPSLSNLQTSLHFANQVEVNAFLDDLINQTSQEINIIINNPSPSPRLLSILEKYCLELISNKILIAIMKKNFQTSRTKQFFDDMDEITEMNRKILSEIEKKYSSKGHINIRNIENVTRNDVDIRDILR